MFRAAALSIALTLATAPNASLLCAVWCHQAAAAGGCEHGVPIGATRVATTDGCPDVTAAAVAVVREDARRGAASDAHLAGPVSRLPVENSLLAVALAHDRGPASGAHARPRRLALRI